MPAAEREGWNFLDPRVGRLVRAEVAAIRSGSSDKLISTPRVFEDLLSSQPLCFNLFAPLSLDLGAATSFARAAWPGRVDRVTAVALEWSPGRGDPRYLANRSAADAALFTTLPGGGRGLITIETKYHENMVRADSPVKGRYAELTAASGAFEPGRVASLETGPLQQIWLDHLLALSVRVAGEADDTLAVVVYPEINTPCASAADRYHTALSDVGGATFEHRTLEDLMAAVADAMPAPAHHAFVDRYLTTHELG